MSKIIPNVTAMGIENTGMDLSEQEKLKITLPGQAGHQGAWDKREINEPVEKNPVELAAVMRNRDIIRQLGEQGFDEIDAIMDRIAEAMLKNPELANDPEFQSRAETARDRLNQLIKQGLH